MNTQITTAKPIKPNVLLATLWIVVMISVIKADILSLYIPGMADELAQTSVITGASIPQLMLFGAVMGALGIVMIPLSLVLKRGVNRRVNLIVSPLYMVYIIAGGTMYPHYIFLATVEVIVLLLICWNAWKWLPSEV